MTTKQRDTWEATDAALRVIKRVVFDMCEVKPSRGDPEERVWEAEMQEVRKWAISVHERRIQLNVTALKK